MQQPDTTTYGWHLVIDGYGADPAALSDISAIYRFLDTLPSLIGMEKIGPPQLAVFEQQDKAGITGVVMIVTSHISIHTYSLKGCLFLDVFSCKQFDASQVSALVKQTFKIGRAEITCLERGKYFPVHNLHNQLKG